MAYEAYKKFTQFHTLLHFITQIYILYIRITPTAGPLCRPPVIIRSVFHTFLHLLITLYTMLSQSCRRLLDPSHSNATLHICVYALTTIYAHTRYTAAGPMLKLLYTVKYSMNHKLVSLIASIAVAVIWYVIYV